MAVIVASFITPTGNVAPVLSGNDFVGRFNVTAQFAATEGDSCGFVEYRQFIKGEMRIGGVIFRKPVGIGHVLSNTEFQEDGVPYPGIPENITDPNLNSAHGYRAYGDETPSEPSRHEKYSPNAAVGCYYEMDDAPGFYGVVVGRRHSLNLTFQGVLIDTRSNMQLANKTWTVVGELG
jgi:hypothetical protein